MAIEQISPMSIQSNPYDVNPKVKTDDQSKAQQSTPAVNQNIQSAATDTVTFSRQALQKLSETGEKTPSKEKKEEPTPPPAESQSFSITA